MCTTPTRSEEILSVALRGSLTSSPSRRIPVITKDAAMKRINHKLNVLLGTDVEMSASFAADERAAEKCTSSGSDN
jgi:hypothetical protein